MSEFVRLTETTYPKAYKDYTGRSIFPAVVLTVGYYVPKSIYWALAV